MERDFGMRLQPVGTEARCRLFPGWLLHFSAEDDNHGRRWGKRDPDQQHCQRRRCTRTCNVGEHAAIHPTCHGVALLQDVDPARQLEEVAALPLEKRYIWRVVSALKWGLADFDDLNVETDRATLDKKDLEKVWDLLKLRPIQFCLLLKALVGGGAS